MLISGLYYVWLTNSLTKSVFYFILFFHKYLTNGSTYKKQMADNGRERESNLRKKENVIEEMQVDEAKVPVVSETAETSGKK